MMRLRARWRAWRLRRRPSSLGDLRPDVETEEARRERLRAEAVAQRVCGLMERPSGPGGARPGGWPCGEVWERLYGRQA
jgi:hypothetical protein